MRRMYSENQLAKLIADNVGKATSLLDGSIEVGDNKEIIMSALLEVPQIFVEGTGFVNIEDEDGNTLQDVLDGKQDKVYLATLDASFQKDGNGYLIKAKYLSTSNASLTSDLATLTACLSKAYVITDDGDTGELLSFGGTQLYTYDGSDFVDLSNSTDIELTATYTPL